jgi:addiction module HigA family antidote
MANPFNPNGLSPPGETLEDLLEEWGWTKEKFATQTGLTLSFVNELLRGQEEITFEIAKQLSKVMGSTPEFWLEREARFRKALERKTMKIWLDDERVAPVGWVWTRTVEETCLLLKTRFIEVISLDNDLGRYSLISGKEGKHVFDWIEEQFMTNPDFTCPPEIRIHTQNSSARREMVLASKRLTDKGVRVIVCPAFMK